MKTLIQQVQKSLSLPTFFLAITLSLLVWPAQTQAQIDNLEDPKHIFCWVEVPREVKVGETFTVKVRVENLRDTPFTLRTLSLDAPYMAGVQFNSSQPAQKSLWEDTDRYIEFDYDHVIAPGTTAEYTLTLTAFKLGIFIGDLDFEEGLPGLGVGDLGPYGSRSVQTTIVKE